MIVRTCGILKLTVLGTLLLLGLPPLLAAQEASKDSKAAEAKPADQKPADASVPKEESSVTDHTIRIGGQTIAYKATAFTTLLKNEKDEPTAIIFSVAYTKSDVKDLSQRPIAFVYNGGPGSSSAWLHMGAFGPRRVSTPNAEAAPPPPYKVEDNANSLLDKTDLVFIDPVGTGYSHAVGKAQDKDFWGIDSDVKSFAQFINTYVTRNSRWNSPKFLIGESYGTFRSAALSNYLQSNNGMYLNGIVLMSTVLDLGTLSFNPGDDMPYIFYLPSYAATAWYHKVLEDRPADLNAFLADARHFASPRVLPHRCHRPRFGNVEADLRSRIREKERKAAEARRVDGVRLEVAAEGVHDGRSACRLGDGFEKIPHAPRDVGGGRRAGPTRIQAVGIAVGTLDVEDGG